MVNQSHIHPIATPVPRSIQREKTMPDETNISKKIIKQAKKGDEGAISALYQAYVDRIFNYIAYRLGGDKKTAEDLTGDVMVRMVKELPKYKITRVPFEAWLYRIASNHVVDYFRRNNKVIESNLPESLASNEPDPESHLVNQQTLHLLRTSLTQLKPDEQFLLSLRFFERKSHEDMSRMLGKSISSIRTMQHRALKRLADLMAIKHDGSNENA